MTPSTPASRIFSVFIVLLGYALFSVVTASIAAILIGEDEKQLRRELHAEARLLRSEIAALRQELPQLLAEADAAGVARQKNPPHKNPLQENPPQEKN
jgi:voltage-gated potassium channel